MDTQLLLSSTEIKPATRKHLLQLRDMMRALHEEHHLRDPDLFKEPDDVEKSKDIATYLDDPNCLVYVVIDKQQSKRTCVAFISGHFCELISTVSKPIMMGSVDELYVKPEWRHKGLGRALMDHLNHVLKQYGATQVFVEVWHSNIEAVKMYQEYGFSHHIHWLRKAL